MYSRQYLPDKSDRKLEKEQKTGTWTVLRSLQEIDNNTAFGIRSRQLAGKGGFFGTFMTFTDEKARRTGLW
jgi:hypothetical protein